MDIKFVDGLPELMEVSELSKTCVETSEDSHTQKFSAKAKILLTQTEERRSEEEIENLETFVVDCEKLKVNCGKFDSKAVKDKFEIILNQLPRSKGRLDIGKLPGLFEIKLKENCFPCYTAQYPSAYKWEKEMKKQCMELLAYKFIGRCKGQ